MKQTLCDICKKDVGIKYFELKRIYKEMDYGMKLDCRTYEVCSVSCLLKLVNELKERKEIRDE